MLEITGSINPTRFVHHQQTLPWARMDPEQWDLPAPLLEAGRSQLRSADEFSLDGEDNILLTRSQTFFGRPDAWEGHLRRYWVSLVQRFNQIFGSAAILLAIPHNFVPYLSLRVVETYWEFQAEDPLAWIVAAEPHFKALGLDPETRTFAYPDGEVRDTIKLNAKSLTLRLRSGVRLRVYAKSNRRVRFEIEHDLRENARPLGGRRTTSDLDGLFGWLAAVRGDAAEELNKVFSRLSALQVRRGFEHSLTQLMFRVASALSSISEAEAILSAVALNGFVSAGVHSPLAAAIRRLEEFEVLQRVAPRSPNFVLTPQFRSAGQRLAAALRPGPDEEPVR